MTMSMYADSAGFINSPGFGALLALAGTVIGAVIGLVGSIWIANRTRDQQRSEPLREALHAVINQRHSFASNQKLLCNAAWDHLQARDITLERLYDIRDPYLGQCQAILLATTAVRLHTKDTAICSALNQLDEICGTRRNDPIRYHKADDGITRCDELRKKTSAAFDSLQTAAASLLAK